MDKSWPQVSFEERFTGTGVVQRGDISVSLRSFTLEHQRYDPESLWTFSGHFADGQGTKWHGLMSAGADQLSFDGSDIEGRHVRVPILLPRSTSQSEISAEAQRLVLGPDVVDGHLERLDILVQLWNTGLALPDSDPLDEIRPGAPNQDTGGRRSYPEQWVTIGGIRLRFLRRYEYESVLVSATKCSVRVPQVVLAAQVPAEAVTTSVGALADRLEGDLADFTRLLTFLTRQHVRWARILIEGIAQTAHGLELAKHGRIHCSESTRRNARTEEFINAYRVGEGELDALLRRFQAHPLRQTIADAIIYIVVAYDSTFVEGRFANAYTALECIVSASSHLGVPENAAPPGAMRKLCKRLRPVIGEWGAENRIPEEMVKAVTKKLRELERRPIIDRVLEMIERLGVAWSDLWPPNTALEYALRQAYGRRNHFIHAGSVPELDQMSADAERILVLSERLLLRLLAVNESWLYWGSFRSASYLPQIPA